MIVATTSDVHGKRIVETIGLVRGSTVRGKHLGKDVLAFLRNLVGGEIPEYSKMLAESREQALDRMMEAADQLGANAVLATRFTTVHITPGAAEFLVYCIGVRLEDV